MITFLAFGDFGFNTSIRQYNINMIHEFKDNINAILSLGDNFYNYGVSSVEDPRWTEFEKAYRLKCPFYAILGNHDYLGNVQAQINYSSYIKTFWRMPSRYYEKKFLFPDGQEGVHVFFLDTFTLCPNESQRCSVGMGMHDFKSFAIDFGQYQWLEQQLSKSLAPWKVVVGHYPVVSNGMHGNTKELVEHLLPILKKYNVDFYLSGHDHDLEFIRKDDINFIVSGTGCSSNPVSISHQTIYASDETTFGFCVLQFHPDHVRFGFETNQNRQIWYSVPKQKNVLYK